MSVTVYKYAYIQCCYVCWWDIILSVPFFDNLMLSSLYEYRGWSPRYHIQNGQNSLCRHSSFSGSVVAWRYPVWFICQVCRDILSEGQSVCYGIRTSPNLTASTEQERWDQSTHNNEFGKYSYTCWLNILAVVVRCVLQVMRYMEGRLSGPREIILGNYIIKKVKQLFAFLSTWC